jgi:phage-related minor tail protein
VALVLGELTYFLKLDDADFEKRTAKAPKTLEASAAPAERAGKKIGEKFTDGAETKTKQLPDKVKEQVNKAGAESAGPAHKAGEKIGEKITDGTKEQLGGLKTAIGASIAGLGIGEALGGLFERQNVGAKIAAQFGSRDAKATAAEAGKAVADIYAQNFGDNLDQVGEAIVSINRNIPGIGDELATTDPAFEHITEQALTLTSVLGQDLPAVTAAAGQLIKTGLAKNASEAFDLITAGTQQGLDKAGDLLDTLTEYPTQFRKLGLSGADALGLIGQGLKGGARDADIVADAIKEFSIRAVDGSTLTAGAFKALNLPIKATTEAIAKGGPTARAAFGTIIERLKAVKDPAKQSQLAVALFGTQAEDLGKALFKLDLSTATKGLGDFAGATDRAGNAAADTAGQKLETFQRGLQTKLVDFLGGSVIPTLSKWWEWSKRNADVLIPIGIAIGTVGGFLLILATGLKVVTLATAAWNLVLAANPIFLVVAALAVLGVGLFLLWKKSETFRAIVSGAFNGVKAAAIGVWNWIKSNWPYLAGMLLGPFGIAIAWIFKHWDQVVSFIKGIPGRLASAGAGMWDWIKESFKAALNVIIRWWNNFDFTAPVVHIPGTNLNVGGFTIGMPDIPELRDKGGRGVAGKPYGIGVPELFVPGASGFFTPLDMIRPGNGGSSAPGLSRDDMKAALKEAVLEALAEGRLRFERRGTEVLARIVDAGQQSLNGIR